MKTKKLLKLIKGKFNEMPFIAPYMNALEKSLINKLIGEIDAKLAEKAEKKAKEQKAKVAMCMTCRYRKLSIDDFPCSQCKNFDCYKQTNKVEPVQEETPEEIRSCAICINRFNIDKCRDCYPTHEKKDNYEPEPQPEKITQSDVQLLERVEDVLFSGDSLFAKIMFIQDIKALSEKLQKMVDSQT